MSYNYDLFVIGAGPGGIAASKAAAARGVSVAVAEQAALGGTCVNRGCVPKKLMVYAADFALQDRLASDYGWSECQRKLNWSQFLKKVHRHLEKLNQSYLEDFQKAGIHLLQGRARFVDPHTLKVDGQKFTADKILIAVGGYPMLPDIPGKEQAITSRGMFHLAEIPKRLAIVGGGYVGVEFASMMNAFGAEVTLMETDELILSGFDRDIRTAVQQGLMQRGIRIFGNTTAEGIEQSAEGLQVSLSGDERDIVVDTVLIATGRAANTQDLGLEQAGVEVGKKGAIKVDEYSRTAQENIFAIGDCTGRVPLTPVAKAEASAVIQTISSDWPQSVNYDYVTSAVFARPEAATVGLTEAMAREQFGDQKVRCYQTRFSPLMYSIAEGDESTQVMLKLVVKEDAEQVLGAHMVGEHAANIVESLAVAIRQGITRQDLNATIGIHPTTGEEWLTLS